MFFASLPILTMMHLFIMLYTYWTALHFNGNSYGLLHLIPCSAPQTNVPWYLRVETRLQLCQWRSSKKCVLCIGCICTCKDI